ncbi:proteasome regulatory particle subunit [Savitreella phatthalungensis]
MSADQPADTVVPDIVETQVTDAAPAADTLATGSESTATTVKPLDDNSLPPIPDLRIAQALFQLGQSELSDLHEGARTLVLEQIDLHQMAPLYDHIHHTLCLSNVGEFDRTKYEGMVSANDAHLASLDEKYKKYEEEEGDMELLGVLRDRAEYLALICDDKRAKEAYKVAEEKTSTSGAKIDLLFAQLRLALFFMQHDETATLLDRAQALIDKGGDWDRRNRFKAYRGIYLASIRKFSEASDVLQDTVATFTSTELCSYADIVKYCVVAGLISLDRADLKRKLVDSPEILATRSAWESLGSATDSLYLADYASFFVALADAQRLLEQDRFLHAHARYWVRELRVKAYNQLLQSYSSLALDSMARSFGVTVDWLDGDLAKFIRQARIHAVIDRVDNVVQTRRGTGRDTRYRQVIAEGDKLLNKLQKYQNALII